MLERASRFTIGMQWVSLIAAGQLAIAAIVAWRVVPSRSEYQAVAEH